VIKPRSQWIKIGCQSLESTNITYILSGHAYVRLSLHVMFIAESRQTCCRVVFIDDALFNTACSVLFACQFCEFANLFHSSTQQFICHTFM